MNKFVFRVKGMHCPACETLTQSEIAEDSRVVSVKSDLRTRSAEVVGNFDGLSREEVARQLSGRLSQHQLLSGEDTGDPIRKEFVSAGIIAGIVIASFFILQKLGLVNLIQSGEMTYGTAFMIGIVASLSSCMAVVGGLLLSLSATIARGESAFLPHLLFHTSRLAGFFVLGGLIGSLGSFVQIGQYGTLAVGLAAAMVMLLLGINLLDIWPYSSRLQVSMPRKLFGHALTLTRLNKTLTPAIAGLATFFLPCGFTQSMQFYTLSTNGFSSGGLTMLVFALGTLPVLAFISLGAFSIRRSRHSGMLYKSAGLIAIVFALINILASLAAAGIIRPVFNLS